ncbi:MAG: hypothetical protein MPN21_17980 [Thermoanaerobaculia bacterium]|nr:hypothetical protein [Thermoanaerobaculia bacterium]
MKQDEQDDARVGEMIEIDWTPIELAIDGLSEGGLELEDGPNVLNHLSTLLASCLRRHMEESEWDAEKVAEAAAETAAFAVDLALGEDELPAFEPWDGEGEGDWDDDEDA